MSPVSTDRLAGAAGFGRGALPNGPAVWASREAAPSKTAAADTVARRITL